jgi:lipopolysaccharide/colanic/teichoic acid biosynthesis glycosyltransferase
MVRISLGKPVLFRQTRPGLHEKPFTIFKFRTMRQVDSSVSSDEQRLSRFGAFLRRTSLDELPELWNVLRGDMSIVGPRPLLTQYLERYTPEQRRRHDVSPGITGWAQINGRNAIGWEERFALDLWYVENRSLWLDMKIIARTIVSVLKGEGIAHPRHATMPEFMGSEITEATTGESQHAESLRR